jgi:hypothetical protein
MAFCNRLIASHGEIFSGAGFGSRWVKISSASCSLALLRIMGPFTCSPLEVLRGARDAKPTNDNEPVACQVKRIFRLIAIEENHEVFGDDYLVSATFTRSVQKAAAASKHP